MSSRQSNWRTTANQTLLQHWPDKEKITEYLKNLKHNLGMENLCGLVGHRTAKNRNLEATSRAIVIQGTKELREKFGDNFRDYAQSVQRVKNIKLEWSKKQDTVA